MYFMVNTNLWIISLGMQILNMKKNDLRYWLIEHSYFHNTSKSREISNMPSCPYTFFSLL